jgi:tRNA(Arg) A34 adenosine deaminase TadA
MPRYERVAASDAAVVDIDTRISVDGGHNNTRANTHTHTHASTHALTHAHTGDNDNDGDVFFVILLRDQERTKVLFAQPTQSAHFFLID